MADSSIKKLAQTLHPLERAVLPTISNNTHFSEVIKASGLKEVEGMRAIQWLENKEIINVKTNIVEVITLDTNGVLYSKSGLPERRFLTTIKNGKEFSISDVMKEAKIGKDEVNICLGVLRGKAAIDIKKANGLLIKITANGKKLIDKSTLEEDFLKKKFPLDIADLKPEEEFALKTLGGRKQIIKKEVIKEKIISLTPLGEKVSKEKIDPTLIEGVTPELLKTGSWKNKDFRRYAIDINVPSLDRAKRHFVSQAITHVKKIWLEMGFKEMEGNLLQTSFWDLDSLFVPQDHPARAMQDTFYIKDGVGKGVLKGSIPQKIKNKIKDVHENGSDTGSIGWGGKWDEETAKEVLMRTHTTVLSAQTISKLKQSDLPAKFFSVNKVFRNEALDASHLFEFYQVEGIVVDENANFRHLLGYLKEFYKKMGYKDVRIRPAHFPYTEPSAEVDVLHPTMNKWIELGGAGIFRPEVVKPLLGRAVPILAWGNGLERILSAFFGIKDIRKVYDNDIKMLKEIKEWTL